MSGSVLRDACLKGDLFNIDRILVGASDFRLMRSPIYKGVQSEGWVQRKAVYDIINDRDHLGQSALHICIKYSQPAALKKIMHVEGVDINLPGMGNYSPAVLAATNDEEICLQYLLDANIDINQVDDNGWTLLHHATAQVADKSIKILLNRRDLNVNAINNDGYTPLMIACIKNCAPMIEKLVGAGADIKLKHNKTYENSEIMACSIKARKAIENGLLLNEKRLKQLDIEEEERQMLLRAKEASAAAAAKMGVSHYEAEDEEDAGEKGVGVGVAVVAAVVDTEDKGDDKEHENENENEDIIESKEVG